MMKRLYKFIINVKAADIMPEVFFKLADLAKLSSTFALRRADKVSIVEKVFNIETKGGVIQIPIMDIEGITRVSDSFIEDIKKLDKNITVNKSKHLSTMLVAC